MANLFQNIPVPAFNGTGVPVDVSAMGRTKSFVCGGGFQATVNVEYSTDAGGLVWAPIATFHQSGNLTIDVAANWFRAVVTDYKGGAPNLDVGSSDTGTLFAILPGVGTAVDISVMPLFKTVVSPGAGNIEVSEDGLSWAQIFSFQGQGGISREIFGQFARVSPGGPDVTMAAANEAGGGSGSGCPCLIVGDTRLASFTAVPNEISILSGNQEVSQTATLPSALSAGEGARCGFKLSNGFGALWHVAAGVGDTIDTGEYIFPSTTNGCYVEFISDGGTIWYLRIVTNV